MKLSSFLASSACTAIVVTSMATNASAADDISVGITPEIQQVEFTHNGKNLTIVRNQDTLNTITPDFALTSRECPPFCILPMVVAPGVETIAELEIIDYIKKMADGDDGILVIDSRTPDWVARGTIPGATNIPWTKIRPKSGATTEDIINILTGKFGAMLAKGADEFDVDEAIAEGDTGRVFDYTDAKTLVMFCNGMWCGQSPANIKTLLKFGYPAEKIKWYRGGMQDWEVLGLSTVKP
ncbi:MAG: rhodanese-like domain-containing protein [Pseudomonadota bacterium]